MHRHDRKDVKSPKPIADSGKVKLGGLSPSLPQVRVSIEKTAEAGKVRLGGLSPAL
jgi:hypothetical protein